MHAFPALGRRSTFISNSLTISRSEHTITTLSSADSLRTTRPCMSGDCHQDAVPQSRFQPKTELSSVPSCSARPSSGAHACGLPASSPPALDRPGSPPSSAASSSGGSILSEPASAGQELMPAVPPSSMCQVGTQTPEEATRKSHGHITARSAAPPPGRSSRRWSPRSLPPPESA